MNIKKVRKILDLIKRVNQGEKFVVNIQGSFQGKEAVLYMIAEIIAEDKDELPEALFIGGLETIVNEIFEQEGINGTNIFTGEE